MKKVAIKEKLPSYIIDNSDENTDWIKHVNIKKEGKLNERKGSRK